MRLVVFDLWRAVFAQGDLPVTETEIRKEILDFLNSLPDCAVRAQQKHSKYRSNRTEKGWPDLSGYYRDKGLFIEVKKPGGTLTMEQMEFINRAKSFGHIALFATSIADVRKGLGI